MCPVEKSELLINCKYFRSAHPAKADVEVTNCIVALPLHVLIEPQKIYPSNFLFNIFNTTGGTISNSLSSLTLRAPICKISMTSVELKCAYFAFAIMNNVSTPGANLAIHTRHLKLIFKIGKFSEASNNCASASLLSILCCEPGEFIESRHWGKAG